MIRIWPNKLDGEPCETTTTDRRMSIAAWLDEYLKAGYAPGDFLPISVKVAGEIIDESDWPTFIFKPSDDVEIRVEPKGTDPFSITIALFAGVKAVFNMLMPKLPGTPNVPGQGDPLSQGSARGNKVKIGDPIRESFGLQKIYPDYLVPPRKYYSDPRTQWMELFLCIGKGRFDITANNVRIGETALLALGAEASYQIFEPGEFVGGNSAATWWHSAPEVGTSSTGATGLELTASTSLTPNPIASSFQFSGYTITIPSGAGSFPADWEVGLVLRIVAPYTYTVLDSGGSARDVISGPLGMLNPTSGDSIEVAGPNAGIYTVVTYTPGSPGQMTLNYEWGAPASGLVPGTAAAAIGPAGLRFKITSISTNVITVDRLTSAGAVDTSFPGFDAAIINTAVISVDSGSLEGGWRGPFPACPEGEVTSRFEWDTFYPGGLCGVGREGQIYTRQVDYELQYRDMAVGGAWTSIVISDFNNTLDQIGFTRQAVTPYPMRPEIRIRKTFPLNENLEWHDDIQWTGLRCILQAPTSYAGCTTIAVKVQVSDRISAQTESQVYVIGTRILPIRTDGEWQPEAPTRNIVPAAIYTAKTLGYTDADLDLAELDRLDTLWKVRGDYFDAAVIAETTAKQLLNDMFGAGFAELTIDRGLIRPVRDEPRAVFEHMYTPQNMTENLVREVQLFNADDFDGVEVTFQSSVSWADEVVSCQLPGDLGRKVEKITAVGVVDRDRAYRIGMRRRRILKYRRDSFSWGTELDGLNSRYMSFCAVADDVPGYGQSALLLQFTSGNGLTLLESSEPLDWSVGGAHMVALRRPDGTVSGPYTATRVDDFRLTVAALDFVPDTSWTFEPPHLLFGPATRWTYPVLVTSVSPIGSTGATVEAIGYSAEVYLSDDAVAP